MSAYSEIKAQQMYTEDMLITPDGRNYQSIGEQALKENKVALIVLAGGQGTRLGSEDPKGCYVLEEIGVSLFELHRVNVKAVNKLFKCKIQVVIMTSSFTNEKTVQFFETNGYFGLENNTVTFIQQGSSMCFDFDNKPIRLYDGFAMSPNGNGGVFKYMLEENIYDKMPHVEYFNIMSVDNVMARLCDPLLIGYLIDSNLEVASKAVTKRRHENVGVFVKKEQKILVKEYSELRDEKFSQGNICNHVFRRSLMKKLGNIEFPAHKAIKKIPFTDQDGNFIKPGTENGYKTELFIFDGFEHTFKNGVINVPRELEFSPLKNGLDKETDNAKTAVQDLYRRSKILLEQLDAKLDNFKVLILPSKSVFGENLQEFKNKVFSKDEILK